MIHEKDRDSWLYLKAMHLRAVEYSNKKQQEIKGDEVIPYYLHSIGNCISNIIKFAKIYKLANFKNEYLKKYITIHYEKDMRLNDFYIDYSLECYLDFRDIKKSKVDLIDKDDNIISALYFNDLLDMKILEDADTYFSFLSLIFERAVNGELDELSLNKFKFYTRTMFSLLTAYIKEI